jgi:hypothetical protein
VDPRGLRRKSRTRRARSACPARRRVGAVLLAESFVLLGLGLFITVLTLHVML